MQVENVILPEKNNLSRKGDSKILEVPIKVEYFLDRKSRVASNLFSYAWRTIKIITRAFRDYKQLKFFGAMGGVIFRLGLILDISLLIYFFYSGSFSPYKIVGFTGAFLNILGVVILVLGLIADMLYRIRMNQEEILYRIKKRKYE